MSQVLWKISLQLLLYFYSSPDLSSFVKSSIQWLVHLYFIASSYVYCVALELTFIWFSIWVLTVLLLRNIFFISHLFKRKGLDEADENSKFQNKNGKGKIGKSGVSLLLSSENQNGNFKSKPLILSAENLEK